jgi:hypothetical protein
MRCLELNGTNLPQKAQSKNRMIIVLIPTPILYLAYGRERIMDERLWPFAINKPEIEWTALDCEYVNLMITAFAEGFSPREGPCGCIDLGKWPEGRSASLVHRGSRNGWEPFLGESNRSVRLGLSYDLLLGENACVCVRPPFRGAAYLALEWMRGRLLVSLLSDFEFVGGIPAGIVLRSDAVTPLLGFRV